VGAITRRTRVVAGSWVSYASGRRLDVERLGAHCRDAGVLLAIDASQGVGGLPFSVREVPCDVVACAGYKWMLGPYGVGFAWVRPGLAERLTPSNVNWFSLTGARNFDRLRECTLELVPGARRFDSNEPGNFLNMAGAASAGRYLLETTPAAVEAHVGRLFDRLVGGLPSWVRPVAAERAEPRSNILCLALDTDARCEELLERLRTERIFLSRREGALRISPHLYNSEEDVDRLLEVLRATPS
jgi:selenocysteine lyase/cysteine desulfurase